VHVYVFYHLILLLYTIVSTIIPVCVNMCACYVFYNKLTYLLTYY